MLPEYLAICAAAGFLTGLALWYVFRRLPTRWLLDYGETEISSELRQSQKLPFSPDALVISLGEAVLFSLLYISLDSGTNFFLILLTAQPLLLIMIADHKTRIIPDQFILALIPCALLLWLYSAHSGQEMWFSGLLWRLAAAVAGGLFLFLCGWIGEKLLHREAMGMGDVKLIAACGLLVGLQRLPLLLILSFISAAFLALPLLLRRLRHPDRDAEMAFGPFIALAAILVLGFSTFFNNLWLAYLNLLAG